MASEDRLTHFDFDLPPERIALRPVQPRDSARLLVVRKDGTFEDRTIRDLPDILQSGDMLVSNTTKVIAASLSATRPKRDIRGQDVPISLNLVEKKGDDTWKCLAKPARRLKLGDRLIFTGGLLADITEDQGGGCFALRFNLTGKALANTIETIGNMPIPPYIAKNRAADTQDHSDYQTIFAQGAPASVAAPTASLHFTQKLLENLTRAGIARAELCLHVGMGTFAPVQTEQLKTGRLHSEWRSLSAQTAERINAHKDQRGRVFALGSTAMRTLESCADRGKLVAQSGPTDIFIQPGYHFNICDGMLTNFHLPRSSLFMMVCAFMGRDLMQAAYAHAIAQKYRFYSYGDACLLFH